MKIFYIIALSLALCGCSPRSIKIADDIIEGEAKVVEQVLEDVAE